MENQYDEFMMFSIAFVSLILETKSRYLFLIFFPDFLKIAYTKLWKQALNTHGLNLN